MARIAVVEDEAPLRNDLVEYLSGCGHQTVGCEDAPALDRALAEGGADILVLDVNLPGENGFSIAKRMREQSEIGIIMLTARGVNVDRVVGLEIGADVYLVKPVELRELEAQIRTLARRMKLNETGEEAPSSTVAPLATAPAASGKAAQGWSYDQLAWNVVAPDGASMKLTSTERVFMALLVKCPGEPVSRSDIFRALGKRDWDSGDRSVDSMVRRLRAKAVENLGRDLPVEAVHGIGYAFAAPINAA